MQDTQRAVNDVNLDIEAGDFVAVLGHNGSGKSTLAKQINALLIPSEGTMWVDDMDTAKEPELWKIRQKAGMVFQNPDNQIIGTVVEEDVGFGPENMGVPTVISLRTSFPEARNKELPSQVLWRCVQAVLYWTSQLQCLTRMAGRKY